MEFESIFEPIKGTGICNSNQLSTNKLESTEIRETRHNLTIPDISIC